MKYSITIPAYKAKFLGKCIDSVLAQTYDDFELIIVNDASPEDLDSIVNSYNDKRIKYYVNEVNCGAENVVDNWNKCLSYASGDYVICMGDDDELSPDCLEQYNRLMVEYPNLDLYHGRVKLIDEDSALCSLQEARPTFESVYSLIWHRMKGRTQFIGDFLFKRTTLIENGGFYKIILAWGSDDISAFIAALNKGVANLSDPVFYYRVNNLSITSSGNAQLKLQAYYHNKQWISDFIANHKPYTELDSLYSLLISEKLDSYFEKRKIDTISSDLTHSKYAICKVLFWLKSKKENQLTCKAIIKAYLKSIKNRASKLLTT